MDTPILVAIIAGAASIVAAAFTFYLTKQKERETEWRKQKLEHYKEFMQALSGVVGTHSSHDAQRRWATASNTVGLVASQNAMAALKRFQNATAPSNSNYKQDSGLALNQLMLAIRADLDISPADDPKTFDFRLWDSGPSEKTSTDKKLIASRNRDDG
jgi:hypothetical protein